MIVWGKHIKKQCSAFIAGWTRLKIKYFKCSVTFMHCRKQLWSLWAYGHYLSSFWTGTISYSLSLQPFALLCNAEPAFHSACSVLLPKCRGTRGHVPPHTPHWYLTICFGHISSAKGNSQLVLVSNKYWITSQLSPCPAHNLGISEERFVLSRFLSL